ncbi:MAG: alpha/beta hydrolase [Candidatus Thorarchaeota archaeon]
MTGEVKPLVDMTLIRKDILEFLARLTKVKQTHTQKYLMENPSDSIDFLDIVKRVQIGNRQNLLERKEPTSSISHEELVYVTRMERHSEDIVGEMMPEFQVSKDASFESIMIGSIHAEWQKTPEVSEESTILYFHGGGFYTGSSKTHRRLGTEIGRAAAMKVLNVDYRLAPEHPYPAALDDAYAAYTWLMNEGYDSSNVVIAGDSAGGYLVLAVLLKIRDEGKPLPAAGVCISPPTDLTGTHNSYLENIKTDIVCANMGIYYIMKSFLGDANPNDAAVSPLLANLEGLPPLLFQASKIEMLYSDSERFVNKARNAGVDVTFQTWDDMIHDFQWFNLPEAEDATRKIGEFVKEKLC